MITLPPTAYPHAHGQTSGVGNGPGCYIFPQSFGARADGVSLDTSSVQAAIDSAGNAGGGTVYFGPGIYLCGTLHLRSRLTLHLAAGAVLLGSRDPQHYPGNLMPFRDAVGVDRGKAFLYAHDLHDICIEGQGTIDGQGAGFKNPRPMLLRILDCRDVTVRNVTLKDSAAWVQHYLRCSDVQISGVRVVSHCNSNNDGINLDGCQRVTVTGCHFAAGDDAFTLKCTTSTPCRDITVTGCLFQSECNGIKFGTESIGGFENITISNCVVYDTDLCGITVATVDGAYLRNVLISNIAMRNVGGAIFVRLGSRGYHLPADVRPRPVGSLRGIVLRDITASGVDSIGSAIMGLEDTPIEDVTLENIRISNEGGYSVTEKHRATPDAPDKLRTGEATVAGPLDPILSPFPEKPAEYPQYNHFGRYPAALYCRHIQGLRLRNVRISAETPLTGLASRPAMEFIDVRQLDTDLDNSTA